MWGRSRWGKGLGVLNGGILRGRFHKALGQKGLGAQPIVQIMALLRAAFEIQMVSRDRDVAMFGTQQTSRRTHRRLFHRCMIAMQGQCQNRDRQKAPFSARWRSSWSCTSRKTAGKSCRSARSSGSGSGKVEKGLFREPLIRGTQATIRNRYRHHAGQESSQNFVGALQPIFRTASARQSRAPAPAGS